MLKSVVTDLLHAGQNQCPVLLQRRMATWRRRLLPLCLMLWVEKKTRQSTYTCTAVCPTDQWDFLPVEHGLLPLPHKLSANAGSWKTSHSHVNCDRKRIKRFTHLVACVSTSFLCEWNNISWYGYTAVCWAIHLLMGSAWVWSVLWGCWWRFGTREKCW